MRKLSSKFMTKYISDAGSKQKNKDYFGFVEMDNFVCWAVAESYDNDNNIISAQLVVDTVLDMFTKKPTISKRKLKSYIKEAHRQLHQQSGNFQLKASILIVASNYKKMRYALCGNSRLHIFRGNNILLKSHDQSLYQDMVDRGEIPDDDEYGMEESRNLFDYLGKQGRIRVSVSKKIILMDEDILLLTTWGFWEKISTIEMLDALEDTKEPLEYLDELQDLYLSKQSGSVNNHTLVAIFANKTFQEKNNTRKIIKIALMIAIPLLIIGIILFIYFYNKNLKRNEMKTSIAEYEQLGDTYVEDENYDRALLEYDNGVKGSKNLKETSGKKGEENKEIKDRLTTKQRTAQLIIDGDTLFKEGKYANAKISYEKALKEAKYNMDFYDLLDVKNIEDKVLLCDDYEYTNDLISLADSQAELGQYDKALSNYEDARQLASKNKNKNAEKDIKLKTESIKSQLKAEDEAKTAQEKEKDEKAADEKVKENAKAELDGDKAVTSGDYPKAIDIYNKALASYVEMGEIDKAAATEKKIADVNTKIKQQEDDEQISIAEGYVLVGDNYMLENKFNEALINYKIARDIYINTKMTDEVVKINEKISTTNTRIKETEIANKVLEIGLLESEGDELLKAGDYMSAKERYRQAQALYQGINQMDKVLLIEDKIKNAEAIQEENKAEEEKASEDERSKIIYTAKTLEAYAQNAFEDKDYPLALEYYKKAKAVYQSAEAYDEALAIHEEISKVQNLMP